MGPSGKKSTDFAVGLTRFSVEFLAEPIIMEAQPASIPLMGSRLIMRIGRILAVATLAIGVSGPSRGDETPESSAFRTDVAPLVGRFCVKCHGPEKPKAKIDLASFADASSALKSRKTWERVREALDSGTMPPEDQPQPAEAEVRKAVAWVDSALSKADCRLLDDPGRVTLRRLNRNEYRNTIRDLMGIDFEPTDDFPSDDVGYGFDNIGDVLTLPPLLMERYLDAAEKIAARAIVDDNPPRPRVKNLFLGKDAGDGTPSGRNGRLLTTTGQTTGLSYEFAAEGDYRIRVQAYGEQAGPEPVKMGFLFDGMPIGEAEVKARAEDFTNSEAKFHASKGTHRLEVRFLNDFYDEHEKDEKKKDRNLVVRKNFWEIVGPIQPDKGRLPESHLKIVFRRPRGLGDKDTIRQIMTKFAGRAYRRTVSPEEIERLMRFFEMAQLDGERFEVGLRLAVEAVLVSPHFLFRVELDRDAPGASHLVNDEELASRLSYFLWSSMPDDELLDLARKGELHSPGTLDAQVIRMLRDPKAHALTENFAGQWLQLRNLANIAPDAGQFPGFDEPLRKAMRLETEHYFESIVKEDRSILDFLDSDFTFLNERLARHYGIDGVNGDEFRRVALKDGRRGGLVGQASVLTVTSNATRTSPVKRGKWVLEQLLGSPPPPPPPEIPELRTKDENDKPLSGTIRQKMEQHRANPSCATCHAKMDPLGFGLENFDAVGAWREQDGGQPIDSSGVLPGGQSFSGPKGLREILRGKSKEFTRCLSEKMLTYALGRGLEDADSCYVDRIAQATAADGHRFSRLVLEIVRSDPFLKRKARGDAK